MSEEEKRITDEFRTVLTRRELNLLDVRRKAIECLDENGGEPTFRESDTAEFRRLVMSQVEKLRKNDLSGHILFKDQPESALKNPLSEEALHWDINSPIDLDPEAAKAILDVYERIETMPAHVHKLIFPLFMTGYMIGHSTRVAIYSALLAQKANESGCSAKVDPVLAALAGMIHDIGKLQKDQKRLVKIQGRFSPSEFKTVKSHPVFGAIAFNAIRKHKNGRHLPVDPIYFREIWEATLKHHVRPDRDSVRSYPSDIPPEELTPLVQIITIADAFDAMTTRNHDQNPIVHGHQVKRGYSELKKCSGTQFDGDLADLFCDMKPEPDIKV